MKALTEEQLEAYVDYVSNNHPTIHEFAMDHVFDI